MHEPRPRRPRIRHQHHHHRRRRLLTPPLVRIPTISMQDARRIECAARLQFTTDNALNFRLENAIWLSTVKWWGSARTPLAHLLLG